jgi:hemolysin III
MSDARVVAKHYSFGEEMANSISHGAGVLFGIFALVLLLIEAIPMADATRITSVSIYGASMILLFLASTLYHAIPHSPAKSVMQLVDHSAIYLLIAGTYTPFMLLTLGNRLGAVLMVLAWLFAVAGILFKVFSNHRYHGLSLFTYLGMGWMAVFALYDMMQKLPTAGLLLVLVGGAIYSVGAIFYAVERIPYNHAIWHIFVLGGTVCHFLAIYYFVMPA